MGYCVGMRMHINLDDDLAREIDEIAGSRGRSKYIREAIEAKLDVDRRVAARRLAFGSLPDFAPWMTPERISQDRKRETLARDEKLRKMWGREG